MSSSPINVLLLGSGGREHALAWKMRQSPRLGELWLEQGANAGLAPLGQICPYPVEAKHLFHLERWLDAQAISLVVVGPEAPLAAGIVDLLSRPHRRVFGPCKAGAQLEADKAFSKQLMRQAAIPTAEGRTFRTVEQAVRFVLNRDEPLVVKAAGLCAGKGVIVCDDREQALTAIERIMEKREFGAAGASVVIEERLTGQELSVLALVDGQTIWVLDPCQDHKQVFEGDHGPNTGGMGAYCPTPLADEATMQVIYRDVLVPTVDALKREGIVYRGVLYAGMMITPGGPKVLEFNCRFGDPETQPLMARLQGDLIDILWRCAGGELDGAEIAFDPRVACCVVVCAGGYPGEYQRGLPISGLDDGAASAGDSVHMFHAGTARAEDGSIVTNGGRVCGVTALAPTLREAQQLANRTAERVQFPGAHFRRDIGHRALSSSASRNS